MDQNLKDAIEYANKHGGNELINPLIKLLPGLTDLDTWYTRSPNRVNLANAFLAGRKGCIPFSLESESMPGAMGNRPAKVEPESMQEVVEKMSTPGKKRKWLDVWFDPKKSDGQEIDEYIEEVEGKGWTFHSMYLVFKGKKEAYRLLFYKS